MGNGKVVVELDDFEQRLMVSGLADFRNDLIRDEKPTEDVDDLIFHYLLTNYLQTYIPPFCPLYIFLKQKGTPL